MLEWTKWGQRTSPLVTQTSTVNHQLSNERNLKREIERQVDLIIESKRTTCHKLRISNWFQRNPKCSHIPSNPVPLFSPSLTLALCEPLSPFSASSDSLLGRWLSRTWASSKSPPQSVAAVCMLIRWPFCAWCVTSGAATAEPNSAIQQIIGRWPREAAPHALPQSYLLRPSERMSPWIWSELVRLFHLGIPSPSSPSPSDPAPLPRLAPPKRDLP